MSTYTHQQIQIGIIEFARATLSDKSKWSRTLAGEDKDGNWCLHTSHDCVRWSLLGAICRGREQAKELLGGGAKGNDAISAYYDVMHRVRANIRQRWADPDSQRPDVVSNYGALPTTTFADIQSLLEEVCIELIASGKAMTFDHTTEPV